MNLWELKNLGHAFRQVEATELTAEEVFAQIEDAYKVEGWLSAERSYNHQVSEWLSAEKRWTLTKDLLANNPVYQAAERGWLAMRAICKNLDGQDEFGKLSPLLQDRYALFAAGVLGDRGSVDCCEDDGQICSDCPGPPLPGVLSSAVLLG